MSQSTAPKVLFNQASAAVVLGIHPSTLSRLQGVHDLFKPAVQGLLPVELARAHRIGTQARLYHREQIRLIVQALFSADLETAGMEWAVLKAKIAKGDTT